MYRYNGFISCSINSDGQIDSPPVCNGKEGIDFFICDWTPNGYKPRFFDEEAVSYGEGNWILDFLDSYGAIR